MRHNIEPIINQYYSCYQSLLATYASYQGRDHNMILAASWGFHYDKYDEPFGNSLSPECSGFTNRSAILLETYHGIKVAKQEYNSKKNLMELLHKILPDSPIMLICDVFNCAWNISYKRNHLDHFILITGIDDKTQQIFVLDPYITKEKIVTDFNIITREVGTLYFFKTQPKNIFTADAYYVETINTINYIKKSNSLKKIQDFLCDLPIRFYDVIQSEYKDVYAIPLILNLRHIVNQRHCYLLFLNEMKQKNLIDSSMFDIMQKTANQYELLRITLIKQILKKKCRNNTEIIHEIMTSEYEAFEKMNVLLKNI